MDDFEKYEKDCQKIRKANDGLLNEFEVWLKSSGISKKTTNQHVSNIDFYINEFLLYEDAIESKDGAIEVGMFVVEENYILLSGALYYMNQIHCQKPFFRIQVYKIYKNYGSQERISGYRVGCPSVTKFSWLSCKSRFFINFSRKLRTLKASSSIPW